MNILKLKKINLRSFISVTQYAISKYSIHQPVLPIIRNASNWKFRSEYEDKPVVNPEKLRNRYTNFYSHRLFLLKFHKNYYYVFFLISILFMSEIPLRVLNRIEGFFGSKDYKEEYENLEKNLSDEPQRMKQRFFKADASTEMVMISEEMSDDKSTSGKSKPKKSRVGFRDSRIIAYEDRIRSYSTPDKIFRYFATIQDTTNEVYMTPQDFVRSISPGVKQPEGLGLDSFRRVDLRKEKIDSEISQDSVFYLFGENALINFSDYVFLLTVISTPQRQFEIAFRMFDLNGDGELDVEEFDVVKSIIRSGSAMGKRHRDNNVTGNTLSNLINSSLSKYFFGSHGKKKLTINDFTAFQRQLQKEIMKLEFERYSPVDGIIREVDFADSLLIYAEFPDIKKKKFLRRVQQKYKDENSIGISFSDYVAFSHLLKCISDVDTALTFYHLAGASIDQATLKHVSKAVANVELSDHLIGIVFTLFDENNDGHLSNKEFIMVMKQKLLRGLDKPMDTGFIRLVTAVTKCAKDTVIQEIL